MTEIIEVPFWDEEVKTSLFYNKMDYYEFQEAEQRRYNKLMSKQIQKMVYEKMGPQLQEAIDRGASAEELEAIMPQTTEEIFALIGTIPNPEMPARLKTDISERVAKSVPEQTDDKKTQEIGLFVEDRSATGQLEPKSPHLLTNSVSDSVNPKVQRDEGTSSEFVIEDDQVSMARVPAAWDASDDEIYALFHVDESSPDAKRDRRRLLVDDKVAVRERRLVDLGHPSFPKSEDPMDMEIASACDSTTPVEIRPPCLESGQRESVRVASSGEVDLHRAEECTEDLGNSATEEQPTTKSSTITQPRPSSSETRLQALRSKLIKLSEGYDHM